MLKSQHVLMFCSHAAARPCVTYRLFVRCKQLPAGAQVHTCFVISSTLTSGFQQNSPGMCKERTFVLNHAHACEHTPHCSLLNIIKCCSITLAADSTHKKKDVRLMTPAAAPDLIKSQQMRCSQCSLDIPVMLMMSNCDAVTS
ncbi:hypothetical protein COO60DRAFT_370629 [Scenedesmus sp. NREL 46B-D3]|nr:hypothetical protein COO60DRAFT_370629 [Scenedesmus sp. NREL 46B-D3]